MIKCKDCKKSEVGKEGRVCYIKAIHYQDIHVKDDDSCKEGIEKPTDKPTEAPKVENNPITPPVQENSDTQAKIENKADTKANVSATVK